MGEVLHYQDWYIQFQISFFSSVFFKLILLKNKRGGRGVEKIPSALYGRFGGRYRGAGTTQAWVLYVYLFHGILILPL
jgi:hypothetical protein